MEEVSTNAERVAFLTETYDISTKNAKALLLKEMGYSHSGIAQALDVTSGTAKNYLKTLEEKIGPHVTESVPKSVRYPTYPGDTPSSEVEYSGDYVDISAERDGRDLSVNKGVAFKDIPTHLISSGVNVEISQ